MRVFLERLWFYRLQARFDFLLLWLWIAIGAGLRFTRLTAKPLWTDEFATLVFSVGNDFSAIAVDRIISIDTLLQPLQPNPDATIADVVSLLLAEDNHPPLYFVLAHLWMKLLPASGEYVNFWVARSLPALLGAISIPAIYWLATIAFNSRLVGQIAAAFMAVSPYGIFLAQETRHYTLAILFIIASLGCFAIAAKYLFDRTILPVWLVLLWIVINGLGLSVHYFFSLTLIAEAIALIVLFLSAKPHSISLKTLGRIGLVGIGAIATGSSWLLILPKDYGNGMVDWIQREQTTVLQLIAPIFQLIAAWITFIALLPVESPSIEIVVFSGFTMLIFFIWLLPKVKSGLKVNWQDPNRHLPTKLFIAFLASILCLFFVLTYFIGIDITRGARYSFTYFPAAIVLLGSAIANFWHDKNRGIKIFSIVFLMGVSSSITVASNLGYQKYYLPDVLSAIIKNKSDSVPVLIATTHKNLVQKGEMMGLAWELKQNPLRSRVLFLLAHQERENSPIPTVTLQKTIADLARPLDVWTVNFYADVELNNCPIDERSLPTINGYEYNLYRCREIIN